MCNKTEETTDKLFKDEITSASSNLGKITLPSDLAEEIENAYKLDMLIEARCTKTANLKERISLYMKEERLSELYTCYYDFYLHLEKKPRRLDATKLRELEPQIYDKYLKDGSEKCSVTISPNGRGGTAKDTEPADKEAENTTLYDANKTDATIKDATITAEYNTEKEAS